MFILQMQYHGIEKRKKVEGDDHTEASEQQIHLLVIGRILYPNLLSLHSQPSTSFFTDHIFQTFTIHKSRR